MLVTAIQFQVAKLHREFARNSEQQKILLGAPPTSQIEEGVSVLNDGGGALSSATSSPIVKSAQARRGDPAICA
jgi:hypothetical protein